MLGLGVGDDEARPDRQCSELIDRIAIRRPQRDCDQIVEAAAFRVGRPLIERYAGRPEDVGWPRLDE